MVNGGEDETFMLCLYFFVVFLGLSIHDIFAQTRGESPKDQSEKAEEAKTSGYPVVLGNNTLFFMKDITGLPEWRSTAQYP